MIINRSHGVYSMKMNKNLSNLLKASLIGTLALSGCSKESTKIAPPTSDLVELVEHKLFSDRYQRLDYAVVLVHLKTPALLETSSFDEAGNLVLDQDHAAAIVQEQEEALAAAKALTEEAELLFKYKYTINALALSVPVDFYDQIEALGMVNFVYKETEFERPIVKMTTEQVNALVAKAEAEKQVTSVTHIQGDLAHEMGITGKGVKVGIVDTGIDYTHKMLGGSGKSEDYMAIDPATDNEHFPNAKVVGGFDFCGSDFASGPLVKKYTIPKPDKNPLDEQGHGTHVAGTVAGIGDTENTYSGVAPDADLYALKVFGKEGGTRDTLVIKAMEWAMDPNGDGNVDDRLDVLNLSLGGGYGKPQILYSLALKNLAKSRMITAISAGNSGASPYIVGAPSTTAESLSVAASVDSRDSNWKFAASEFHVEGEEALLYQRVEAQFSKPISEAPVTGKLVYIGDAATDLSAEQIEAVKGNVALIDRGGVTFLEKFQRAFNAGASAVVVANNQPGAPITMSGDVQITIPGIMITLDQGKVIKDALAANKEVIVDLGTERLVERPELIDQITSFSSQGPRSEDGLLKPEITAPGYQILSARIASGFEGTMMNGTSMSAPHMAGVLALLKQKFPTFSVEELKAVAMNHAKFLYTSPETPYTMTLQGAGLVQAYDSLKAEAIALPASFSLGQFQLAASKTMKKVVSVKNISSSEKTYTLELTHGKLMSMKPTKITVKAGEVAEVPVYLTVNTTPEQTGLIFHEGLISLKENDTVKMNVPVFGASQNITDIKADSLVAHASSELDAVDSLVELTLTNHSPNPGSAHVFNLLAKDDQKPSAGENSFFLSRSCDLQAVGYKMTAEDNLQIGIKIFNPVSNWQACELSVLIDSNGDKQADQEIGGLSYDYLSGLSQLVTPGFYSVLLDFPTAVGIRAEYEQAVYDNDGDTNAGLNYAPAIRGLKTLEVFENSHLAIINVDPRAVQKGADGRIHLRVTSFNEGGIQYEDGLGLEDQWFSISALESEQSFRDLPQTMELGGKKTKTFEFTKGQGSEELMLVYPANKQVQTSQTLLGKGLEILKPKY